MRSYYYTQLATRRSWMPLFYWLLDTAIVNSYIIYRMYNPSVSHKEFRLDLAEALYSSVDLGGFGDHAHILIRSKAYRYQACKAIGCTARTQYVCNICGFPYCLLCT